MKKKIVSFVFFLVCHFIVFMLFLVNNSLNSVLEDALHANKKLFVINQLILFFIFYIFLI